MMTTWYASCALIAFHVWQVAARAAERRYEESKQETSQLRTRLLIASNENGQAIIKPVAKRESLTSVLSNLVQFRFNLACSRTKSTAQTFNS